jgi:hypothetical protein
LYSPEFGRTDGVSLLRAETTVLFQNTDQEADLRGQGQGGRSCLSPAQGQLVEGQVLKSWDKSRSKIRTKDIIRQCTKVTQMKQEKDSALPEIKNMKVTRSLDLSS